MIELAKAGSILGFDESCLANAPKTLNCTHCLLGKMIEQKRSLKAKYKAKRRGEIIYSDISGRINPKTKDGYQYLATFTDSKSRYKWVYLLKKKHHVFSAFEQLSAEIKTKIGRNIEIFRSDNGGEYRNYRFSKFCKSRGIKQEYSAPYCQFQNGMSERSNLTIFNLVRSMLSQTQLPRTMWGETAIHAVYTRNCCLTSGSTTQTPYERWHKKKPRRNPRLVTSMHLGVHVWPKFQMARN